MEIDGARRAELRRPDRGAGRRRAHRALHVEGDPRLLHVHRVRSLLGQLPGAQDRARSSRRSTSRSSCAITSTSARTSSSSARCARARPKAPRPSAERRRDRGRRRDRRRREAPAVQADRPRPRRHPPRRALGVHHLPRLRRAVPGDDLLRRQDRRHAAQPRHDARASSRTSSQKPFQAHGGQRQPVEPLAHGSRRLGRRPRHPARWPRSPTREVLYWVGCAASYDDRAKKIARATAQAHEGRRASTSRSSARKRPARAIRRGAPATSSSSRCSPSRTWRRSTATRSRAA